MKNDMIRYVALMLFLVCLTNAASAQNARLLTASSRTISWPKTPSEIIRANSYPKEQIEGFVNALLAGTGGPSASCQEFRFVPMEASKVHLIATADFSGRGFYFWVLVISPQKGAYEYLDIQSDGPHFLAQEVIDINGDGLYEVVAKHLVGGYEGAATLPVYWLSILKVQDGRVVDVSKMYPDFYKRIVLPEVSFMTNVLNSASRVGKGETSILLAEYRFVYARVQRRIFGQKNAGLEEAIQWSESKATKLQELAIDALREIENPLSVQKLKQLTLSQNPDVARRAKQALAEILRSGYVAK
jgi:hypothetical protein